MMGSANPRVRRINRDLLPSVGVPEERRLTGAVGEKGRNEKGVCTGSIRHLSSHDRNQSPAVSCGLKMEGVISPLG